MVSVVNHIERNFRRSSQNDHFTVALFELFLSFIRYKGYNSLEIIRRVILIMKYYAVRKGRETGIFTSWDKCKSLVMGFKGADYKSFKIKEEAEAYMSGRAAEPSENEVIPEDTAIAYVDGSYRNDTEEFSCGAILFYEGREIKFSTKYNDPDMAAMRNVAGEIMGSVSVLKYCLENGIKKIRIYHDYEGVAKWAMGEWKTNKDGTKAYREFCSSIKDKLSFSFVKVKGHSGDKYNDVADHLAKDALGIEY